MAVVDQINDDAVFCRDPHALWRRTLDGILVLGPSMAGPLQISTPGDLIWALLSTPITVAELVASLADHFNVEYATVQADVQPIIVALQQGGAVTVTSPP